MTRLVHLTDLHFGAHRPELVAPLVAAVRAQKPALILVSGDLSHRARGGQFRAARAFLDRLGAPYLTVPGNHDVPLFNLIARALWPFRSYRRTACADLAPDLVLGRLRVFSANTADPAQWRGGLLRATDLERIRRGLAQSPAGAFNLLMCHHPLREPPGFDRGETRGAAVALPVLAREGLHLVVSGHLHHWAPGLGISGDQGQPILMVQSGTALCGRQGEHDHGFAVIDLAVDQARITPWIVAPDSRVFGARPGRAFRRADGIWYEQAGFSPSAGP